MKAISRGFTAIELLVVVAIMAVLAMVGVPRASSMLADARLNATVRQLVADAQYVRQLAVQRGETLEMRFIQVAGAPHQVRVYRLGTELTELRRVMPVGVSIDYPGLNFAFNYLGETVGYGQSKFKSIPIRGSNGKILWLVVDFVGRIRIASVEPKN